MALDIAFSVCIPLYNKRCSIPATIAAVLGQSHEPFEIVIVDDGSTDDSAAVVAAIADPRLRLIRQPNKGVSEARNAAWRAASAEYIAFLDADDLWDADYLETQARLIADYPGCGAYGTGYRRLAGEGRVVENALAPELSPPFRGIVPDYFRAATHGDQPFFTSSLCAPRAVLEALSGFRTGISHGEDLDLWARIALHRPVAFESCPKVAYRLDSENRAMRRAPPLGWVFRDSVAVFRRENPDAALPASVTEHIDHIELYHAALNLYRRPGAEIRRALRAIAPRPFGLRKSKIWAASLIPPRFAGMLPKFRHQSGQ